ncbi:unannotated protein [freshwater metagenome]|uniref:Unannotated protein n=1 Tax=freshwater metagenome TaxID=449393 RepID=A0A6J7J4T4_9ZZZZ
MCHGSTVELQVGSLHSCVLIALHFLVLFYARGMEHHIFMTRLIPIALICPFLITPSHLISEPAIAQDCSTKACIDVYTQNGEVIIVGKKGSGIKNATAKPTPKPTHSGAARPVIKPKVGAKPKVLLSPASTKKTVVRRVLPRKSTPGKTVIRKSSPSNTSGVSLNDRLVKLLPIANIFHQPTQGAIVNVPMIYWCGLPELFNARVAIVGEVVDVAMRPSFVWSFGDGSIYATTKAGAAYPNQEISHSYSHAGTFIVAMVATWGGTWTHNGVARAITGTVRKVSISTVNVANAPLKLAS